MKKLIATFLLVYASQSFAQLDRLIGKTANQVVEVQNEVTNLDSSFFVTNIESFIFDLRDAILSGRSYSASDYATLAAALTAMRTAGGNPLIIPGGYSGSPVALTSADSLLVILDYRYGKETQYGIRRWGFSSVTEGDSLNRFKKLIDSTRIGGKLQLSDGTWTISDSVVISSPLHIAGTMTKRSDTNVPQTSFGAMLDNANTNGKSTLVNNTNGSFFQNLYLRGNRYNGSGFKSYNPSGSATTMADWVIRDVYSEQNGRDGFEIEGGDGAAYIHLNAQFNARYGIYFKGATGGGLGGITNNFYGSRTRRNSRGGWVFDSNPHTTMIGCESVDDTTGGIYIHSNSSSQRAYGNTFIGTDVERPVPSLSSPSTPIYNWRFDDISSTTMIGNFIGTKYEEGSSRTLDAGTTTTAPVDAALLATVDDYYVGWEFVNTTRSSGIVKVTDYVASTKTLTLASAIASQVAGDSYTIKKAPNRGIDADSIFSAVLLNNHFTSPDSEIVVRANSFANLLFIGEQLNFTPDSIRTLSGATLNYGQLALSKTETNGELWLKSNRELEVSSKSDSVLIRSLSDSMGVQITGNVVELQRAAGSSSGSNGDIYIHRNVANGVYPETRIYYESNISSVTADVDYITIQGASNQNNRITVDAIDDSTSIGYAVPVEFTGDQGVARYFDVLASDATPTTFAPLNNRVRVFAKADKLYTYDDNGDSLNVTAYAGSATWNPGNLTAGSTDSTTVTVTGAVAGDAVIAGLSSITSANANIQLWGHVISAGSVRVFAKNNSAGTYDIASGTVKVRVWK